MDHDLIWRLEALYTAAWPPLRRESVGDWLVKFAPGVSRRANSANPLRARLRDVDSSIEACARRYRDSSMPALFRIRRDYEKRWQDHNRLLPVQVAAAVELDDETLRGIGDRISEQTGRRVDLSSRVEPVILGGIVVRVGNQVLEASIRNRLETRRKQVARG